MNSMFMGRHFGSAFATALLILNCDSCVSNVQPDGLTAGLLLEAPILHEVWQQDGFHRINQDGTLMIAVSDGTVAVKEPASGKTIVEKTYVDGVYEAWIDGDLVTVSLKKIRYQRNVGDTTYLRDDPAPGFLPYETAGLKRYFSARTGAEVEPSAGVPEMHHAGRSREVTNSRTLWLDFDRDTDRHSLFRGNKLLAELNVGRLGKFWTDQSERYVAIVSGEDNDFSLFDITASRTLWTRRTFRQKPFGISFSPDARYMVARFAGDRDVGETVRVIDVLTGKDLASVGEPGRLGVLHDHVAFIDGDRFAFAFNEHGKDDKLRTYLAIWSVGRGRLQTRQIGYQQHVGSLVPGVAGRYLLIVGQKGGTTELYDTERERVVSKLDAVYRPTPGKSSSGSRVRFSDRYIVLASDNEGRSISILDIEEHVKKEQVVRAIESELSGRVAALRGPRTEFESTNDYRERLARAVAAEAALREEFEEKKRVAVQRWNGEEAARRQRLHPITLNDVSLLQYDADTETYRARIAGAETAIRVPREQAAALKGRKLLIKGDLRYHDDVKFQVVNARLVDAGSGAAFAFGPSVSANGAVAEAGQKGGVPVLEMAGIRLVEPSGNSALDGGEEGEVVLTLRNNGKGMAHGLELVLNAGRTSGLHFNETRLIGQIGPGEEKQIAVRISADESVEDGQVKLAMGVREANGFDAPATLLAFESKALVPPELQVASVTLADSEGRRVLSRGREIGVALDVRNGGAGPARGVKVEMATDNAEVRIFSEQTVDVGVLNPGESRAVKFSFAVTQRYAGPAQLPLRFTLKEARDRYNVVPEIPLALDGEAPDVRIVTVKAKELAAPVAVGDDIDIPPVLDAESRIFGNSDLAVVIGIESYRDNLPRSEFSYADARVVKSYLLALGFQERNIESLTNERATLSDLRRTIERWLPNRAKPESRVFVYFSGHGAPDPASGEAYIVPYDGDPNYLADTGYPLKRLYDALGKLETAEAMVVTDACFSGAGGRSVLARGTRPLVMVRESEKLAARVAVLSSTRGGQISTSSQDKKHGLFTYYFLKGLKEGKRDLASLHAYLRPLVEDEAKRLNVEQSPSLLPEQSGSRRFVLRR